MMGEALQWMIITLEIDNIYKKKSTKTVMLDDKSVLALRVLFLMLCGL